MKDFIENVADNILGITVIVGGTIIAVVVIGTMVDWVVRTLWNYLLIFYFIILLAAIFYKVFQKYWRKSHE